MTTSIVGDTELNPSSSRLEALSDGIYAIAMTLLVLNIEILNVVKQPTNEIVIEQLLNRWQELMHYMLSFILLGSFWTIHHIQFHYIKKVNRPLLWINIINLMFIALLPFSTSFVEDYGDFTPAAIFFHANLLIIGLMFYINWFYATWKRRLVAQNMSEQQIVTSRHRSLVIPFIASAAILISLVLPRWSSLPYVCIPFLLVKIKRKK